MNIIKFKLHILLAFIVAITINLKQNTALLAAEKSVEKLAIIGTRVAPRSVGDSSVPLDIISAKEISSHSAKDMTSLLQSLVPSFNVNDQPISDEATFIRPANLRGLAPDHTLILINGKRRHRSAVISFLGGGLSNGSQGPDISAIPSIALKQIEVLRDGASAQYGSDAIAGVINFVLKEGSGQNLMQSQVGSYLKGDGQSLSYQTHLGVPLKKGFANFSFEFLTSQSTSSSVQRADAAALIAGGNTKIKNPAQAWGAPGINYDFKLFVNAQKQLSSKSTYYIFSNYSQRKGEGGFFFRNPETRKGVFADANGAPLVSNSGFRWDSKFPGGFTPKFGATIVDNSINAGVKGYISSYNYDLSAYWGSSSADYFMNNTINSSLGDASPTSFKPGKYIQDEKSVNLDMTKSLNLSILPEALSLAAGLEARYVSYQRIAGDPNSYAVGPLANEGFSVGSNGFPGLDPKYEGKEGRNSTAIYIDAETYLFEDLNLSFATRYEHFSDFGSTFNGKVASRYQLTDNFAVRSALSTGFKAPTIGQNTIRKVSTAFTGAKLSDVATIPPTDPLALANGGKALVPEKARNFSLGFVADINNNFFITTDYFNIKIQDRINLTSKIPVTNDRFSEINFFANDFSTITQGIDVVANYNTSVFNKVTKLALAFNWTDTSVNKVREFQQGENLVKNITDTRIKVLEENLPKFRYSLSANQFYNKFNFLARFNYFASFFEDHLDADGVYPIQSSAKYTIDLEVTYKYQKNLSFVVGAKNALNTFPDKNPHAEIVGSKYPVTSPIGINGGFYYLNASYSF